MRRNKSLFDHLVGASTYRLRNGEAQCFGSLEIDYKLVLRRRLYRKIGWLLALQDAINVAGRTPEIVGTIRSVGDQAAIRDDEAVE